MTLASTDKIMARPCARVMAYIVALTGVSRSCMVERNNRPSVVDARAVAMWTAREVTGYSLPRIGREFERDHTSVLAAIKRVDKARFLNPALKNWTNAVLQELRRQ